MMPVSGPLLPLGALIWPLLMGALAALPPLRARAVLLLPLAPLPALWLAGTILWQGPQGSTLAPDLLLGVTLGAGREAALLLGTTALVWLGAGVFALRYMADRPHPAIFAGFWCLTLAGNLGVFLAQDVVTFYVSFAAVSLAAWFLVVHDGTDKALRAGRVYVTLVIMGEVCLLAGLVIGVAAAGGLGIAEMRQALPGAAGGSLATGLLIAGFGVKAGLMPLHVWLPLAHPAAPVPASAVLSGAIVKAGIVGLMLLVPQAATPGLVLTGLGVFTGFAAALLGLTQRDPKAVLAYSTISQMGLIVALLGAALQGAGDMRAAAFYAAHHGLAKGALFLSVGLVAACAGGWRTGALAGAGLVALSVAGAPLTGGGLAKTIGKDGLDGFAANALTLSAVTTTLLLVWFLACLSRAPAPALPRLAPRPVLWLPVAALGLLALLAPWPLRDGWSDLAPEYPLRAASLWSALWPVAAGLALAGLAALRGWRAPVLPQGDILAVVLRAGRAVTARWPGGMAQPDGKDRSIAALRRIAGAGSQAVARLEGALLVWRNVGLVLMLLIAVIALTATPP